MSKSSNIPFESASMVSLYVFNPAHKMRFLSGLIYKGSKRVLRNIRTQAAGIPDIERSRPPPKFNLNVFDLIKTDLRHVRQGGLTHDAEYYKDDMESGFCVFRVEDTLFKVHKCYLLREPSAFGDMFSLPFIQGSNEGQCDDAAIPLSDTAEQFRDLLWVLYAIPSQLCASTAHDEPSLQRLINIAQLTNKYCIASYEAWAFDKIFSMAQDPTGFLRYAPPEICAQALNLAVLCNHQKLLDVITQRLVARMLWSDINRQPILEVAERRGLTKLQGVAYYKELVEMERMSYDGRAATRPTFLPGTFVEKRRCFLAAHHSLVNLWECVRMTPPVFLCDGCSAHADCLATWTEMWLNAGGANQTLRHGSADVLGRLKSMMIFLKKSMNESTSMGLECTLAALESITTTRDDIIAGLIDHFHER